MLRRTFLTSTLIFGASGVWAQGKKQASGALGTAPSSDGGLNLAGDYAVKGRYPNGNGYTGSCRVTQSDATVDFTWIIGDETTRGTGMIEGRVVTVDWGDTSPVVYVIMPNGSLHGTWSDGTALERLSPS